MNIFTKRGQDIGFVATKKERKKEKENLPIYEETDLQSFFFSHKKVFFVWIRVLLRVWLTLQYFSMNASGVWELEFC